MKNLMVNWINFRTLVLKASHFPIFMVFYQEILNQNTSLVKHDTLCIDYEFAQFLIVLKDKFYRFLCIHLKDTKTTFCIDLETMRTLLQSKSIFHQIIRQYIWQKTILEVSRTIKYILSEKKLYLCTTFWAFH